MKLLSPEFFSTVALACGPPARVPDGWTKLTKDAFVNLVKAHFQESHIPLPETDDDLNRLVQGAYEFYLDWYERQHVRR